MGKCGSVILEKDLDEVDKAALEQGIGSNDVHVECDPRVLEYLKQVPLLTKLTKKELALLGGALVEKEFEQGERIITEGDTGENFYLIEQGVCSVQKKDQNNDNKDTEVCQLKAGDYFGEAALRSNSQRSASVLAFSETVLCLCLDRTEFQRLFGKDKLKVKFGKRKAVFAESYDPQAVQKKEMPDDAITEKKEDQFEAVQEAMQVNMLFRNLDISKLKPLVDAMWLRDVPKGTDIITQGDLGDNFYVVEKGNFDIFVKGVGKVAERDEGNSFGELALLYNAPRAATVTATEDSQVWVLGRYTYKTLVAKGANQTMEQYEDFLSHVQTFSVLLTEERMHIAKALEVVKFKDGHIIAQEGDMGDTFFILKSGKVIVTKKGSQVHEYSNPGDCFGERALVTREPRAASCIAQGAVECLYLNSAAFTMLLGPLEDIFNERVEDYKHAPDPSQNKLDDFTNKDIRLEDLNIVGTLGKGSFGHVQLVQDKTGYTYALKAVSKGQVIHLNQEEHIMSEKRVMAALEHPFLVKLHATFKDDLKLYFLLEPSLGGELFSLLSEKTFFDEPTSRFFAGCVILGFEYMHSKNMIYRDLKPENLLLDNVGYLKITDFGFAKVMSQSWTYTLCGTPDYLAPEVVSGEGHGKGVDWWTLGILIYEMLNGMPPFNDDEPIKIYNKIIEGKIVYPMHFSKSVSDLIKGLLAHKPTKRFGVIKGGASHIKKHSWYNGFDWDAFLNKKIPAPLVKPVEDKFDLSNFDSYPDEDTFGEYDQFAHSPKIPNWDGDF